MRLTDFISAQTLSPSLVEAPRGQRGGGSPTVAPADRPFPLQLPGMRVPASQAAGGKSPLHLAFVRNPAPAPHVGAEPCRQGGRSGPPPRGVQNRARGDSSSARTTLPHLAQGAAGSLCRASLVAQMIKNLLAILETQVQSLGCEDPLEREIATHSSTLAWRISWTEEPGRLQSMGSQRVRHD